MSLRIASRPSSGVFRSALASSSRSYRSPGRSKYDIDDERDDSHHDNADEMGIAKRPQPRSSVPARSGEPYIDPDLQYVKPDVRPDVDHPSYLPSEIMDFRDASAKLPPALAVQRQDKLRKARSLGIHQNRLNKREVKVKAPPPIVPVRVQGKQREDRVKYHIGATGVTTERREYLADEYEAQRDLMPEDPAFGSDDALNWNGAEEKTLELEAGRIIEVRRSGKVAIGMVLAQITMSGRQRIMLLKSNGELWTTSSTDAQYVMPASLIDPDLARACWSPDLISLLAAEGDGPATPEAVEAARPMQDARRKVVIILRKIQRETERMCGKMMGDIGRSSFGGIEGLWAALARNDKLSTITAAEAAEYMLNADNSEKRVVVKPQTLPAYAAHCLMMRRSDLFLADQHHMAASGEFTVRSKEDHDAFITVKRIVNARSIDDKAAFAGFVDKVKRLVAISQKAQAEVGPTGEFKEIKHDVPAWTEEERLILSEMMRRMYETRMTQTHESEAFATNIMKVTGVYGDTTLDRSMLGKLLVDLGALAPWDSSARSEVLEMARRGRESSKESPSMQGLLNGDELDELRHDFTGQTIYVIDAATASELDDGISIERIPGSEDAWIHVHVADPTRFIPINSEIANAASFQGSSLYLPEGGVPLFPLEMIMEEVSLGAEVTRDQGRQGTLTFSTKLSPRGETLDSTVRMGWIHKPRPISYNAVNNALGIKKLKELRPLGVPHNLAASPKDDVQFSPEELADLKLLETFANAHRLRRMRDAGLEYFLPQGEVRLLNRLPESPFNIFPRSSLPARPRIYVGEPKYDLTVSNIDLSLSSLSSEQIVAEMMIASGRTAARFCGERGLPAPYRTSQVPQFAQLPGQKLHTVEDLLAARDPVTLRSDAFATLSTNMVTSAGSSLTPGQHWAMGFNDSVGYTRATSPLRRFDDLLAHWQIKAAIARERGLGGQLAKAIPAEDVQRLLTRSDMASRRVQRVAQTAQKWWHAGLLASRRANPKPEGYDYSSGFVDVTGSLDAVVCGQTVHGTSNSKYSIPILLPQLGILSTILGSGRDHGGVDALGQELTVRLLRTTQWPSPVIGSEIVDRK